MNLGRTSASILVALLAACGKDAAPDSAEFAELCGASGPVLLLPLAPDQRPTALGQNSQEFGDRLFFVIGSGQRKIDENFGPLPERESVYSVGPCGEEPALIGPDVESVFTNPNFPGVLFGCRWNTNELVRLDPTGAAAPEDLDAPECPVRFTPHGLVGYDPTLGTAFYPTLDPAALTFGEPIPLADHVVSPYSDVHALSDEIVVRDGNYDLVRVSLPDFDTRIEAEDVASFMLSDDGRYMMTQRPIIGSDEEATAEIYLHDRSDGRSVLVGSGGELGFSGSRFYSTEYALVSSVVGADFQRVVTLPKFAEYPVPTQYDLRNPLPDGRWLAVREGSWYVLDLRDEDGATLVTELEGSASAYTDEYLDLRTGAPAAARDTVPLIRFFFDAAKEPVQLAPRVTRNLIVQDDGRIVTPVEVDESWLGGLVLVDPEDQRERLIDERVVATTARVGQYPGQPDVLLYGVVDGERTGVWIARPAPRDQEP